jgi:hypothetical protein
MTAAARPLDCDLCVIGAGIAGLNALFVAAETLPRGARVVLVDRNPGPGGMWTGVYEHVRLHQPHAMFTVGDMPWRQRFPRAHLASGAEVRAHLADCLERLRGRLALTELFAHEAGPPEEASDARGAFAALTATPRGGGAPLRITARRLVDAAGFDVAPAAPLPLSSRQVLSTTPERLAAIPPRAPVWIVGGGKTGMDCAQALLSADPARQVTVLGGQGTLFGNRTRLFPEGWRRHVQGRLQSRTMADIALRWDGGNDEAVFDYFRETYALSPGGGGGQYFFAMMSESECRALAEGLTAYLPDYLEDVTDTAAGPEARLRSGARQALAPGTVLVNCTGHLLRRPRPYRPFLSPGGSILTITSRSAIYLLSSASAYFLSHLFLAGRLRRTPLWEMDLDSLRAAGRKPFFLGTLTLSYLNTLLLMEALPMRVMGRCGLDLDRWYPLPRRAAAALAMQRGRRAHAAHCREALTAAAARHGVRCGVLAGAGAYGTDGL